VSRIEGRDHKDRMAEEINNAAASTLISDGPNVQVALTQSQNSTQITGSSVLLTNAAATFLSEAAVFVILLLLMPKLVLGLGTDGFGLFSLAWVVLGYLSLLDIGVSRAATKFVASALSDGNAERIADLSQSALVLNLLLGVLGGLLLVALRPLLLNSVLHVPVELQAQAKQVLWAVAIALPFLLGISVMRAVFAGLQRFPLMGWIHAVSSLLQWGLACGLAWKGYGVAVVVAATVAVRAFTFFAYFALLVGVVPARQADLRRLQMVPELLRFGGWVSISQLISPILVYADRALIATFDSLAAVALYTVPFELTNRLRIIPASMMATLFPAFSERAANAETSFTPLYTGAFRVLLVILLAPTAILTVFGHDVLTLWMGAQFASKAFMVTGILAMGVLFNSLAGIPYSLIQGMGRPDITGKIHLVELPAYFALCFWLIPHWGIVGAAIANTLRLGLDALVLFIAAGKYCRCWIDRVTTVRTVYLGILLTASMIIVKINIPSSFLGIIIGLGISCIYAFIAWIVIFTAQEKRSIATGWARLKLAMGG